MPSIIIHHPSPPVVPTVAPQRPYSPGRLVRKVRDEAAHEATGFTAGCRAVGRPILVVRLVGLMLVVWFISCLGVPMLVDCSWCWLIVLDVGECLFFCGSCCTCSCGSGSRLWSSLSWQVVVVVVWLPEWIRRCVCCSSGELSEDFTTLADCSSSYAAAVTIPASRRCGWRFIDVGKPGLRPLWVEMFAEMVVVGNGPGFNMPKELHGTSMLIISRAPTSAGFHHGSHDHYGGSRG